MKVIKAIVEDKTLSPTEKVLFAILYCRKEGNECTLSAQELARYLGVKLEAMQESLQNLEHGGFIKIKKDCHITDASSFLSCAVLGEGLKHKEPDVPRP
ncbi:MAG: hypothetical protein LJE87_06945 [Deltaproteobacteria bacterium]|jgi:DNA-binding MarR family transcriptional regulator|nr:hypothetical protein [Deltaproteobacteria bacterium]